jgi:hypothetical protein
LGIAGDLETVAGQEIFENLGENMWDKYIYIPETPWLSQIYVSTLNHPIP